VGRGGYVSIELVWFYLCVFGNLGMRNGLFVRGGFIGEGKIGVSELNQSVPFLIQK